MKFNRWFGALLILLVASAVQSPGQTTDAERNQFQAVRARADKGDADAQLGVAALYASGRGVARDPAKAAKYIRKAADQGLAEAQFDLGMCYANGDGVAKNPVGAVEWYRKAAAQDLADAECEIGNCYLEGNGVPTDIPEGLKRSEERRVGKECRSR